MAKKKDQKKDRRGGQPPGEFGAGNPPHEYDPKLAAQISKLAALQMSQDEIADVLEISRSLIRTHYHKDWKAGKAQQGVELRSSAFQMARGILNDPDHPEKGYKIEPDRAMIMFLLKTQFGFKETSRHEVATGDINITLDQPGDGDL